MAERNTPTLERLNLDSDGSGSDTETEETARNKPSNTPVISGTQDVAPPIVETPPTGWQRAIMETPSMPIVSPVRWKVNEVVATLRGEEITAAEVCNTFNKWAIACYGKGSDNQQYWEKKVLPLFSNSDILMSHAYSQLEWGHAAVGERYEKFKTYLEEGDHHWFTIFHLFNACERQAVSDIVALPPAAGLVENSVGVTITKRFLHLFLTNSNNGRLMRSLTTWNDNYAEWAMSQRPIMNSWRPTGTSMTIFGFELEAKEVTPCLKEIVTTNYGTADPAPYWHNRVLAAFEKLDNLMRTDYSKWAPVPKSEVAKLNMFLYNGDQLWGRLKKLLGESEDEAFAAVDDAEQVTMVKFLETFLFHPKEADLMRSIVSWVRITQQSVRRIELAHAQTAAQSAVAGLESLRI